MNEIVIFGTGVEAKLASVAELKKDFEEAVQAMEEETQFIKDRNERVKKLAESLSFTPRRSEMNTAIAGTPSRRVQEFYEGLRGAPGVVLKVPAGGQLRNPKGRIRDNAPCPCGSGKKFKKCCR